MTIDERIEAIAQSLELLASMHRDEEQRNGERFAQVTEMAKLNDERFAQFTEIAKHSYERFAQVSERLAQFSEIAKRTDERFAQVTHNFEIVLDSIKRLERIALAHEDRIDDHQDRIEDLEGPK